MIKDEEIDQGRQFITNHIEDRIGIKIDLDRIHLVKISNMTKDGIPEFQEVITNCFFTSFDIQQIIEENLYLEVQDSKNEEYDHK